MEELIDLIATDGAPSDISDNIKQILYTKSLDKVNYVRPEIASSLFGDQNGEDE
jgi:hypothetical protein